MLALQVTEYLESLSDVRGLSKMALCRIEHLYFKIDLIYTAMRKLVQQQQVATTIAHLILSQFYCLITGHRVPGATEQCAGSVQDGPVPH